MKKALIVAICIICLPFFKVFGQSTTERGLTDQGRIILGTSAGLSFTGVQIDGVDDTYFNFSLNTSGGYFIMDNLALNLQLDYQYTKFGDESSSSVTTGLSARYYFPPMIFIGTGYITSIPDEGESSGYIPAEVGYAYFLNRNIALEPAIVLLMGGHNNATFAYSLNLGVGIYLR